ncbi:TPA: spore coat protein [Bacillus thuringiensis]|uniref:Spore coat protein n=14 Tax=Bacillus cereus group TaxID=86661 RepID=A0A9X7CL86_BACCE|nr:MULTISPECIES: spore coat protein [Bacillus]MCU7390119.1 spore coat protein [Bacillus sp. ST24]MDJ0282265.1 spore coat protein [Bacillus bombysepticus]OUB15409.1 spore coat protein [Bacillus thuringiensis serovar yunnanensis]QQP77346.1 spore coat protein [Bacillus sp. TK-2]CGG67300.1 Spore coat protein X [Streptococcus pneumoniae]BCA31902.1 spore coat protein X [Bacillus wiedmannii]
MCDCEVCRRKKKRDPLNRGSEPKKQDSESVNSYSFSKNANFLEEAIQTDEIDQVSEEYIEIVDSADVQVTTTDTKAALSIQAALQAAIVVVVSISIADSEKADKITQELFQKSSIKQINRQKTFIKNSRNVTVTTTDTDIAVNIQILLQILLALLVKLNIL